MFRFTQGVNFASYDNKDNSRMMKYEALCNVEPSALYSVKKDEFVEVDFDGDNSTIWNATVIRKDVKNHRVIVRT